MKTRSKCSALKFSHSLGKSFRNFSTRKALLLPKSRLQGPPTTIEEGSNGPQRAIRLRAMAKRRRMFRFLYLPGELFIT